MFIDMLIITSCFIPLAEKLEVPVIGTVATRTLKTVDAYIGMPSNPATIPSELINIPLLMTFTDRIWNTWAHFNVDYFSYTYSNKMLLKFYRRHFPNYVHGRKKISLVFFNNHHTYLSRPSVHNAIDIAGIHVKTVQPLPQVYLLESFVGSSTSKESIHV